MYCDLQNQHYLCKNFVILTASYSNLRNFLDNIKKTHLQCWYIITTSGIFNWNGKHETSAVVNITLYILLAHSLCCKTTDCRTFFPLGKLLYKYKLSLCHLNSSQPFFPNCKMLMQLQYQLASFDLVTNMTRTGQVSGLHFSLHQHLFNHNHRVHGLLPSLQTKHIHQWHGWVLR